jgi:hypothetical protein
MAQQFILKGHHIEVKYTIGITPGLTALTYRDGSISHDFKTDEITTEKTRLGSLVSIALVKSVDTGALISVFFYPMFRLIRHSTSRQLPSKRRGGAHGC